VAKETDEDRYRAYRHFSQYLTIPLLLAVTPFVGLYLGKLLDRLFHTGDILSLVFLVLGFIAGGREVYRIVARIGREDRAARESRAKDRDRDGADGA
jgi:ATP synthase protein I